MAKKTKPALFLNSDAMKISAQYGRNKSENKEKKNITKDRQYSIASIDQTIVLLFWLTVESLKSVNLKNSIKLKTQLRVSFQSFKKHSFLILYFGIS